MYLSPTQKEELIIELKIKGHDDIARELEEKGVDSSYLLFINPKQQQVAVKISEDSAVYSQQDIDMYKEEEFMEIDVKEYYTDTISLSSYSTLEFDEYIKGFYDSMETLKEIEGENWQQALLSCIFKKESLV